MKTKLWKNFIATLVIFILLYCFGPTFLYLLKDLIYPTIGQSYESSAIGNLRTVVGAQSAYKKEVGGFTDTWDELRKPFRVYEGNVLYYFDIDLSGVVRRYKYTLKTAGDSLTGKNGTTVYTDFECIAEPVEYEEDTNRSFYVDSSGVVRYEFGKVAKRDSNPL